MKLTEPGKFLLRKCGREIQTLCRFTGEENIFNRFADGNNLSMFLAVDTDFEAWHTGKVFHEGWDDIAPFMTRKFGTVGANHGSPFAFKVTMPRHWYFKRDIGRTLTDDAGNRFIIVRITGVNSFIVHSEAVPGQIPCFNTLQGSLYDNGRILNDAVIRKVQLGHDESDLLLAHYRFNKTILTSGGKPVPENTVIECSSAELHWDVDLCLADALLEYIKAHPGQEVSTVAAELAPAAHLEFDIIFRPDNSYTIECDVTFLRDIEGTIKFGMIQHFGTVGFDVQEKYIPGLKPFEIEYSSGEKALLDLNTPTVMKGCPGTNMPFYRSDCLDPENPPRIYTDIFGDGRRRRLGVELSYSELCGITAKNSSKRGDYVLTLPNTNKIYPYAFYQDGVTAGETFKLCASRRYFDPES